MTTLLRQGPYRVYFVGHDLGEPVHVHVDRGDRSAKFWLGPVRLVRGLGFRTPEIRQIWRLLDDHEGELIDAWHRFFGTVYR